MILRDVIFKNICASSYSDDYILAFKLTNTSLAANQENVFALSTFNRDDRNSNLVLNDDQLNLFFQFVSFFRLKLNWSCFEKGYALLFNLLISNGDRIFLNLFDSISFIFNSLLSIKNLFPYIYQLNLLVILRHLNEPFIFDHRIIFLFLN